ncbi:MAG: lytic transglycosylase domain-containing protein [Gammaproteobacteria bacterium]
MISLEMMMTCAPNVAPVTLQKIIQVESGDIPLTVNVNVRWVIEHDEKGNPIMIKTEDGQFKPKRRKVIFKSPIKIKTVQDAVTVAYIAINAGHTVDLGYMQINSSNLQSLGYSVEDMFDTCKNLAAGARLLSSFYNSALSKYPNEQGALRAALSAYNTGDFIKGSYNGYLSRYGVNQQFADINPYTTQTSIFIQQMSNKEEMMSNKNIVNEAIKKVARVDPLVSKSSKDSHTPGVQVEYTAEEAEANGAFQETAMPESEAWASNIGLSEDHDETAIMINGKPVHRVEHFQ